jgi:DNA-binding NarL/FixJ family response regulator
MRAVTVRVLASDPGTREGAIALLSAHPGISVLTTRSKVVPDVLFVNTTLVSESVVRTLELAPYAATKCPPRIVVVTEQIGARQLARVLDAGVVCLLDRRRSGYDRIARAIVAAAMVPAPRSERAPEPERATAPATASEKGR